MEDKLRIIAYEKAIFDPDTGVLIRPKVEIYDSLEECANKLQISTKVILRSIESGKYHVGAKRFFDYEPKEEDIKDFVKEIKIWKRDMERKVIYG